MSTYSEYETEIFYDNHNEYYKKFWDKNGSLHWGYYEDLKEDIDFSDACIYHNDRMGKLSNITKDSVVLDLGCGNGTTSLYLAKKYGCTVYGIDISQVRIDNALKLKKDNPDLKLNFYKSSGTILNFNDCFFTHIWIQAVIYHIPEKQKVFKEIYRILQKNGILIMDDLTKPQENITNEAKKYVYDRLLFDTNLNHEKYIENFRELGFNVLYDEEISEHLYINYYKLSKMVFEYDREQSHNYDKMCECIKQKQLGWSIFMCIKNNSFDDLFYYSNDIENIYNLLSYKYNDIVKDYIGTIKNKITKYFKYKKGKKIIDLGCGTGLLGSLINDDVILHGVDLSKNMLDIAEKTKKYKKLFRYDLNNDIILPYIYDFIISTGTFTKGHIDPNKLFMHTKHLISGGKIIITLRSDLINDNFWEEFNKNYDIIEIEDFVVMNSIKLLLVYAKKKDDIIFFDEEYMRYGDKKIYYDWLRQYSNNYYDKNSGQKIKSWDYQSEIKEVIKLEDNIIIRWIDGYEHIHTLESLRRLDEKNDFFYKFPDNIYDIYRINYNEYIENNEKTIELINKLNDTGIVIIENCHSLENICSKICNIKETIYGKKFFVQSEENFENIANSANEIKYHMDLQYYNQPPGVQLLNCIELENCKGGDNIFIDMYEVVNKLKKIDYESYISLSNIPMNFIFKNNEYHFSIKKPIIELDPYQNIKSINWSYHWETVPDYHEYEPKFKKAYSLLLKIMDDANKLILTPKIGQCIIFMNTRLAHSRTKFVCQKRIIEGCYLDLQEFKAIYRKLNY